MPDKPPPPFASTFMWNELMSTDIEKAKKFYSAVLGWEYDGMPMGEMGTYWLIRAGQGMAGGAAQIDPKMHGPMPSHWMPYVAVKDVNATAKKAEKALLYPPMDVPDVGRMTAFKDPTGAVLSIMTPKEGVRSGKPEAYTPGHGCFMWNELSTSDMKVAETYLTGLLGWKCKEMEGSQGQYKLWEVEGVGIGGMMPLQEGDPGPSRWMGYISVKDIEAINKSVPKNNGKVLVPPMDVPGIGKFIVAQDPTGAVVAMMQPAA